MINQMLLLAIAIPNAIISIVQLVEYAKKWKYRLRKTETHNAHDPIDTHGFEYKRRRKMTFGELVAMFNISVAVFLAIQLAYEWGKADFGSVFKFSLSGLGIVAFFGTINAFCR